MDRIVLGRRNTSTWHGFEWTGAEPDGLYDPDEAVALGARFEGDELVTYDVGSLAYAVAHREEPYLADSD